MESRICYDDEIDTFEEKASVENELPLPHPFPPDDADVIELDDNIHSECDYEILRKEALLRRIVNDSSPTNNRHEGCDDKTSKPSFDESRHLDRLPSDVFVLLCCSLTVREITSLAACSKSLYAASLNQDLWRAKFQARWNYDDPTIVDWSFAYRQAYSNPHDLWVTHWNCVEPCDGLGPGRCCVRETENQRNNAKIINEKKSHATKNCKRCRCPSCRYHPCLESENQSTNRSNGVGNIEKEESCDRIDISTAAQAIQTATNLRLEESSHLLPCKPYSPKIAEHAFKKASTFHRFIDHRQYKDNSLFFLNDLLFFHVHDDHDDINDEPFEMRDWKKYIEKTQDDDERAQVENPLSDSESSEPALHSWHLANVCNPDYDRPIIWRILIQRSDCFTVFPSEGYLLPGESKVVTFGVKPFGSLLAHATHQLNVHRNGVDEFWDKLHAREARLPCTPFLFQYHYATNAPCHFIDNACPSVIQQQRQQQVHPPAHPNPHSIQESHSSQNQQANTTKAPWRQCSRSQPICSLALSRRARARKLRSVRRSQKNFGPLQTAEPPDV